MSAPGRPRVAIGGAEADTAMLTEWLHAAGFEPLRLGARNDVAAVVVRWPATVDLRAAGAPVIVLHDAAAPPPTDVVAELVPWPDTRDVRSLLDWSSQLIALLRRLTAPGAAAAAPSSSSASSHSPSSSSSLLSLSSSQSSPASPPSSPPAVPAGTASAVPALGNAPASALAPTPANAPPAVVPAPASDAPPRAVDVPAAERRLPELIAIGVSTGGPVALRDLLADLRGHVLPPMLIVQHIPASFVAELAARLQRETGYACVPAADGGALQRGVAYIAPGDRHLRVLAGSPLRCVWTADPPRRGHRPSADVLFESCATANVGGVGVIMTGMGQDGAQGLLRLRQLGWTTLGQDEASSAIYGMPRAARLLGAVQRELPLAQLGGALVAACAASAPVAARVR